MQVEYGYENLVPGHLGYFFIVLSFVGALLSAAAYLMYTRNRADLGWRRIGRLAFLAHGIGVLGIFTTLFYLIYHHQFQYHYVWAHSSKELPAYYMISCFWEGQEGSFLLWTFWHAILGGVLIARSKTWEGPVMLTLGLAQVMLASMLLGLDQVSFGFATLHFPEKFKLGSNPFILTRKAFDIPIFQNPNYYAETILTGKLDGRGLNPLLQNYWMVIHPPVLFLGFASTIVPFCYAMAGLWTRRFTEWVRPALPWAAFGCMMLGTGVLMGGAWAYEALSFGGFWAWDPVENASLVPWLIFVAGLHTMVIFRARKSSLTASYLLIILTFLLILYSTFLTRSGVLSDTSVHSFTDLGLSGQLLIFMWLFILLAFGSLIRFWKAIPKTEKEESTYSREFWMFIGALVLSLSALHIISITSIPVIDQILKGINKLLGTSLRDNYDKPTDVFNAYHSLQIPFAIIIALLSGFSQYLRYINTPGQLFWRKSGIAFAASLPLTILMAWLNGIYEWQYLLLIASGFFSLAANADIMIGMLKNRNIYLSGAAVAHLGFALILIGALISNGRKEVISLNTEGYKIGDEKKPETQRDNKVLFQDLPVKMGDYQVTYRGDSVSVADKMIYYKVEYKRFDEEMKKVKEQFTLYPEVIYNPVTDEISSASPSTRHYLTRDIFTHFTSASKSNSEEFQVKYDRLDSLELGKGESVIKDSVKITLVDIIKEQSEGNATPTYRLLLKLKIEDGETVKMAEPALIITGTDITPEDAEVRDMGMLFRYRSVELEKNKHKIFVMKGNRPPRKFLVMKAIIFPYINLLWIGSVVMVIGFFMAMRRRGREVKE